LAQLPQDWVARNVRFPDDKIVEFALRAPNGRLIPIDSKWTATELLDQLGQTTDEAQQDILIRRVRSEVFSHAREVLKYLDNHRTMGFCIAAVPDPVFQLCSSIQPRLVVANIVLISYSLLVPYILLIVKIFWSSAQSVQALQISHILSRSLIQIEQLQQLIDTDVRSPLNTVKEQHDLHNEQLQAVLTQLSQIQSDLNALQTSLPKGMDPLTNTKIASIPGTLKHHLAQLRDGLFEGAIDQNGQAPNEVDQKPIE
jgi:DNA recombination protein RmuC